MVIGTVSTQLFQLFTVFKVGKMSLAKYGHLTLPGTVLDKVIPDIDFADEAVVHCDVPVI